MDTNSLLQTSDNGVAALDFCEIFLVSALLMAHPACRTVRQPPWQRTRAATAPHGPKVVGLHRRAEFCTEGQRLCTEGQRFCTEGHSFAPKGSDPILKPKIPHRPYLLLLQNRDGAREKKAKYEIEKKGKYEIKRGTCT